MYRRHPLWFCAVLTMLFCITRHCPCLSNGRSHQREAKGEANERGQRGAKGGQSKGGDQRGRSNGEAKLNHPLVYYATKRWLYMKKF